MSITASCSKLMCHLRCCPLVFSHNAAAQDGLRSLVVFDLPITSGLILRVTKRRFRVVSVEQRSIGIIVTTESIPGKKTLFWRSPRPLKSQIPGVPINDLVQCGTRTPDHSNG